LFQAKVFSKKAGAWRAVPAPPGHVSNGAPINIAVASVPGLSEPSPCLGFTEITTRQPIFTCRWDGAWHQQPDPVLAKGEQLVQLQSREGVLSALFEIRPTPRTSAFRVLQLTAEGWKEVGSPITGPAALAQLGDEVPGSNAPLTVGIETQTSSPSRFVLALEGGTWRRVGAAIKGPGIGPLLSGPAAAGRSILFPVVDTEEAPWSFAAHPVAPASSKAAEPNDLSNETGNAQGRLDSANGDVWATWQEDKELPSGDFKARIYAARLNSRGAVTREIPLWGGVSVGPGNTQVVEFRGHLLALYMPSGSRGDAGLQATVKPLSGVGSG
jgi:hypothetical protein